MQRPYTTMPTDRSERTDRLDGNPPTSLDGRIIDGSVSDVVDVCRCVVSAVDVDDVHGSIRQVANWSHHC